MAISEDTYHRQHLEASQTSASSTYSQFQNATQEKSGLHQFVANFAEVPAVTPVTDGSAHGILERIGRTELDTCIRDTVNKLEGGAITSQNSKALVLMNASGVGKTYGPITARWGQQQLENGLELVTAYIGFSSGIDLTQNEVRGLISRGERGVRLVIYKRLFAVLCALLNTAKGDLKNLDEEGSAVQKCIFDNLREWEYLLEPTFDLDDLTPLLKDKLVELGKLSESPVTLLVAVDEAQLLDALVKVDGEPMGARFALHCLRELQQEVRRELEPKTNVLILPVAMGTDPTVSLDTQTDGTNVVLSKEGEVMLSRADFRELAHHALKKLGAPNEEYWDMYQAALYPRARALVTPTSAQCLRHRRMSWVPKTQFKLQRPPTTVFRRICRLL